jgi:hypothetical protein
VSTSQLQQQQQQSFVQLEKLQHPCSAVEMRAPSLSSLQENLAAAKVPLLATSDAAAAACRQELALLFNSPVGIVKAGNSSQQDLVHHSLCNALLR